MIVAPALRPTDPWALVRAERLLIVPAGRRSALDDVRGEVEAHLGRTVILRREPSAA